MRDKLVELIQNAVGGCARHWAELIADQLMANGVTIQQWIPVSESLPERAMSLTGKRTCIDSNEVLVYVGSYSQVLVAKYWHDEAVWEEAFQDLTVYGVTHWMPLPEPPKEGE